MEPNCRDWAVTVRKSKSHHGLGFCRWLNSRQVLIVAEHLLPWSALGNTEPTIGMWTMEIPIFARFTQRGLLLHQKIRQKKQQTREKPKASKFANHSFGTSDVFQESVWLEKSNLLIGTHVWDQFESLQIARPNSALYSRNVRNNRMMATTRGKLFQTKHTHTTCGKN